MLDVEAEMHNVAFLNDVFLTFQSQSPRFFRTLFAVPGDKVVIGHDFSANKTFLGFLAQTAENLQ